MCSPTSDQTVGTCTGPRARTPRSREAARSRPATMGPSTALTICPRVISAGGPGEDVPPSDAALGAHQARTFQGQQDLLEVGLGQPRPLGDVAHRGRARANRRAAPARAARDWRSRRGSRPSRSDATWAVADRRRRRARIARQARLTARRGYSAADERRPGDRDRAGPSRVPAPALPDYGGACLASVVPALLSGLAEEGTPEPRRGSRPRAGCQAGRPARARRPGVGAAARPSAPRPDLAGGRRVARSPRWPPPPPPPPSRRSPPATPPAVHGMVGYRLRRSISKDPTSGTRARRGDERPALAHRPRRHARRLPAPQFQPVRPFAGRDVPVVTRLGVRLHRLHRRPPERSPLCRMVGSLDAGRRGPGACSGRESPSSTPTTTASTRWPTSTDWATTTARSSRRWTAWWATCVAVPARRRRSSSSPPTTARSRWAAATAARPPSSSSRRGAVLGRGPLPVAARPPRRARRRCSRRRGGARRRGLGSDPGPDGRRGVVRRPARGRGGAPARGRGPGGPCPRGLPRSRRHRRDAPDGPARLAHPGRDVRPLPGLGIAVDAREHTSDGVFGRRIRFRRIRRHGPGT